MSGRTGIGRGHALSTPHGPFRARFRPLGRGSHENFKPHRSRRKRLLALFALLATAGLVIGLAAAVKPEAFKASRSKVSAVFVWRVRGGRRAPPSAPTSMHLFQMNLIIRPTGCNQQAIDGPATTAATPLVPSKEVEAPVRVEWPGVQCSTHLRIIINETQSIYAQAAIAIGEPNPAALVVEEPQADAAASTTTTATPAQPVTTTPTLIKNSGTIHHLEVWAVLACSTWRLTH